MAAGPTVTVTVDRVRLSELLSRLSTITRWVWRITPGLLFQMFDVATKTPSLTLSTTNATVRRLAWQRSIATKTNRLYVSYGTDRVVEQTQTFAPASAGQTSWVLTERGVGSSLRGYLTVDGVMLGLSPVGEGGSGPWRWNAETNAVQHVEGGAPAGTVVSVTYDAQFPGTVTVETVEALTEPWEDTVSLPDIFSRSEAQTIGTGLLRSYGSHVRRIPPAGRRADADHPRAYPQR
jgi:hypothetical protein